MPARKRKVPMRRAVFLDRDGVLTRLVRRDGRAVSPRALAEFAVLPGTCAAVEALRRADLLAVVVTNQPDIARGALAPAELRRMHDRLVRAVPLDAIYTCTHDDADGCPCRKPKPGLLVRAAEELQVSLKNSWMVGDRGKDIEAGKAAGCSTLLVEAAGGSPAGIAADFVVSDLAAAVEVILQQCRRKPYGIRRPRPEAGSSGRPFPEEAL